ncbi:hypothetical protein FOFC_00887 [Fusarium oxysporum]|nr:hypothetical protein FOFC_00887 [Fusarium oxysporum]
MWVFTIVKRDKTNQRGSSTARCISLPTETSTMQQHMISSMCLTMVV